MELTNQNSTQEKIDQTLKEYASVPEYQKRMIVINEINNYPVDMAGVISEGDIKEVLDDIGAGDELLCEMDAFHLFPGTEKIFEDQSE